MVKKTLDIDYRVTGNDSEFQLVAAAGWKAIEMLYMLHITLPSGLWLYTLQLALLVASHLIQNNQELGNRK